MEEISEVFDLTERINVYNDGAKFTYDAGSNVFNNISVCWKNMIADAHQMPAFGVSLNEMTVEAMKKDLWVEFDFGKVLECNEMPFEKLLVQVHKENSGFNLIRYTKDYGYDGRCFYLDLVNKNMAELYDLLQKYSVN